LPTLHIPIMSKITPKNLQYDGTLPPFLARMQANNNSRDGRHEFQTVRPKKARTADEEAEDEPVYFDEGTGETLSKSEWEAREKVEEELPGKEDEAEEKLEIGKGKAATEKVAAIGVSKKRKAGKVIGGDDGDARGSEIASKDAPKVEGKKVEKGKSAKKAKKIKLSFGDDE